MRWVIICLESSVGGTSSGVGVGTEAESLLELLSRSVDSPLAVLTAVQKGSVVLDGRLEVTSTGNKVLDVHGLVSNRLVDDRSLVGLLVDGNNSVGPVVLVGVALDDRLNEVVNVVRSVGVDLLALVNDGLLGRTLATLIALSVQRSEHSLIFIGGNMTLLDVGFRVDLLVVLFLRVLSVENGLDVVLNVVNVSVNFALTFNFLNLVTLVGLVGNGSKVLVVVDGSLGVVLVEETVLLGLLVVVSGRVSVFPELVADRLVGTVGRGGSGRGRFSASDARRRSSRGCDARGGLRSGGVGSSRVGSSGRRSVLVSRVVGKNLLNLVHC